MAEIKQFYLQIPPVTRFFLTSTVIVSTLGNFFIVPVTKLVYHQSYITGRLELWRLFTCFYFTKFGFGFLMSLFFLYNYSNGLETTYFKNRPGDYVFCVGIIKIVLLFFATIFDNFLLLEALIMTIVYIWSQANKETIVNFMFGLRFKAMYLPLVLLAYETLLGQFSISSVYAMLVGHIYWYIAEIYPQLPTSNGYKLLKTPAFIENYFPPEQPTGNVPTTRADRSSQSGFYSWGRGHKLGSQ